jgi:hypothetical protein
MIKGLSCAPQGNECRECAVYRYGSLGAEDIKLLLHDQKDSHAGDAIRELIQRKKHLRETEN